MFNFIISPKFFLMIYGYFNYDVIRCNCGFVVLIPTVNKNG
jgi:hypothetical protein